MILNSELPIHQFWGSRYTHRLITEAAIMLTAAWGTKLGQPVDSCGSLMMVGLPAVRASAF